MSSPRRSPGRSSCAGISIKERSVTTYAAAVDLDTIIEHESEAVKEFARRSKPILVDGKIKPTGGLTNCQQFGAIVRKVAEMILNNRSVDKGKILTVVRGFKDDSVDIVKNIPMYFGGTYIGVNQLVFRSSGYLYKDIFDYLDGSNETIEGNEHLFAKAIENSINHFVGKCYTTRYIEAVGQTLAKAGF